MVLIRYVNLTTRACVQHPHLQTVCKLVAIALHYFFLTGYMFMALEAAQTMVIVGRVIPKGHIFSTTVNLLIGWGRDT